MIGVFTTLQGLWQIVESGVSQAGLRDVSRVRAGALDVRAFQYVIKKLIQRTCLFALAASVLLVVAAGIISERWLSVNSLKPEVAEASFWWMALILGVRLSTSIHRAVILGFEAQRWLSGLTAALAVLRLGSVASLFAFGFVAPSHYFGLQLVLSVVEGMAVVRKARQLRGGVASNDSEIGAVVVSRADGFGSAILVTSGLWALVTYADRIVLSQRLPLAEFGMYAAAVAAAGLVGFVVSPVSLAVWPRLSRSGAQGNSPSFLAMYSGATEMLCGAAFPVAATIALFPAEVLALLTGISNPSAELQSILRLHAVAQGFLAASSAAYYLQYSLGDLRFHLRANVILAVLFLPSLFIVTQRSGAVGAASLWAALNVAYFVIGVPLVHRRFIPGKHGQWLWRDVIPSAAAATAACVLLRCVMPIAETRGAQAGVCLAVMGVSWGVTQLCTWRSWVSAWHSMKRN